MNKPAPDWHAAASALRIDGRAFIGGTRVATASGETFAKTSPIDGRMLGDIARGRNEDVDTAVASARAYLLGIIQLDLPGAANAKARGKGPWAGFLLGLLFGLALGPCTFAYMAPILAIVLAKSATSLIYGVPLLLAYGIGHCAVIVFAGTFTRVIENYLRWNEGSPALAWVKRVCGLLLFVAAAYMAWSR